MAGKKRVEVIPLGVGTTVELKELESSSGEAVGWLVRAYGARKAEGAEFGAGAREKALGAANAALAAMVNRKAENADAKQKVKDAKRWLADYAAKRPGAILGALGYIMREEDTGGDDEGVSLTTLRERASDLEHEWHQHYSARWPLPPIPEGPPSLAAEDVAERALRRLVLIGAAQFYTHERKGDVFQSTTKTVPWIRSVFGPAVFDNFEEGEPNGKAA